MELTRYGTFAVIVPTELVHLWNSEAGYPIISQVGFWALFVLRTSSRKSLPAKDLLLDPHPGRMFLGHQGIQPLFNHDDNLVLGGLDLSHPTTSCYETALTPVYEVFLREIKWKWLPINMGYKPVCPVAFTALSNALSLSLSLSAGQKVSTCIRHETHECAWVDMFILVIAIPWEKISYNDLAPDIQKGKNNVNPFFKCPKFVCNSLMLCCLINC